MLDLELELVRAGLFGHFHNPPDSETVKGKSDGNSKLCEFWLGVS